MGVLAYTSAYQLMYLLLETAEGKLTSKTVNETFQAYLFDLNEAIKQDDIHDLEAVRNSIYEYYEAHLESEEDIEKVAEKLANTFRAWHVDYPEIIALAKEVLKELL